MNEIVAEIQDLNVEDVLSYILVDIFTIKPSLEKQKKILKNHTLKTHLKYYPFLNPVHYIVLFTIQSFWLWVFIVYHSKFQSTTRYLTAWIFFLQLLNPLDLL